MKRKVKIPTLKEVYIVTFVYKCEKTGYHKHEEKNIAVELINGMKEKCNHTAAEKIVKSMYPTARIIRVIYA